MKKLFILIGMISLTCLTHAMEKQAIIEQLQQHPQCFKTIIYEIIQPGISCGKSCTAQLLGTSKPFEQQLIIQQAPLLARQNATCLKQCTYCKNLILALAKQ